MSVVLQSILTCPHCGASQPEIMPVDTCLYFYECPACNTVLRPKHGDCCVFCSYGSVGCPSVQDRANVARSQSTARPE